MDRTKQQRLAIEAGQKTATGVLARASAAGHRAVQKPNSGRASGGITMAPSDPTAARIVALAASAGHPALRHTKAD